MLPIAEIIEVKKNDFDQGRAQLYMQLHSAFEKNVKFDAKADFPLYGAVTNSLQWIFVKYTGKKFAESLPRMIANSSDKKGIKAVFGCLTVMFETQTKACRPFVEKMRAEMK